MRPVAAALPADKSYELWAVGGGLSLLVALVERSARDAGASLARVYVANTVGCILGSAITGFALLPALGTNRTLYMLLVLLVGAMAVFLLIAGEQVRVRGGLQHFIRPT